MFNNKWDELLCDEFEKPYYKSLCEFLDRERNAHNIFPPEEDVFNALRYTDYDDVKVLIVGQDPYHEQGQAHGLSFSVRVGIPQPPSLKNIFKELTSDLGCYIPDNGCLTKWAQNGVMLLNTVLTVREGEANSHKNKGWEHFTDRVIACLNAREKPVIFLLWGSNAKEKLSIITGKQHYVLSTVHPSPLSATRGFFGCRHFSKTNAILNSIGVSPIDWQIENVGR